MLYSLLTIISTKIKPHIASTRTCSGPLICITVSVYSTHSLTKKALKLCVCVYIYILKLYLEFCSLSPSLPQYIQLVYTRKKKIHQQPKKLILCKGSFLCAKTTWAPCQEDTNSDITPIKEKRGKTHTHTHV